MTSSHPTMGTSMASPAHVAKPERGRSVPRNNSKGGSTYPETSKANRKGILERHGATLHPVMKAANSNSPEAGATERNLVMMPARGSYTDSFRSAKMRAQSC